MIDQNINKPSDEKLSFSGGDAVPTIFCGSVCTPSSPARKNEADTRLVLRMAMTGVRTSERITRKPNVEHIFHPLGISDMSRQRFLKL